LHQLTLRCKGIRKSTPEPLVALQSNSPRLHGKFPGKCTEFLLFSPRPLNFHLCNGMSINSFFSKRARPVLRS
jgi:hypothetical protein